MFVHSQNMTKNSCIVIESLSVLRAGLIMLLLVFSLALEASTGAFAQDVVEFDNPSSYRLDLLQKTGK